MELSGVCLSACSGARASSSLDLTMNVYTDRNLLDIAGALAALPDLPLSSAAQADAEEAAR